MKYFSHLNTAAAILDKYTGTVPFHHFLREYLRQDKKFGSGDRRNISRLCYSALRLGQSFRHLPTADKIRAGLFLCTTAEDAVTTVLLPGLKAELGWSIPSKWQHLQLLYSSGESDENVPVTTAESLPGTTAEIMPVTAAEDLTGMSAEIIAGSPVENLPALSAIFPAGTPGFSAGLEPVLFYQSFFIQPDLFARIRPGKELSVTRKLEERGISFEKFPPAAIRLAPATKLDEVFAPDQDLIIQDYSSQLTLDALTAYSGSIKTVWDACAASGGKSLLTWDAIPGIHLTVSDNRKSILANLSNRFKNAGIRQYSSHVIDLSKKPELPFDTMFDLVIADVPCSGSGTWSRTPEQLVYFDPGAVDEFQKLQQQIISRILPAVKPGGYLLYITCSVFKKENEDNIEFLLQQPGVTLISQALIKGYDIKADTMFSALLTRR